MTVVLVRSYSRISAARRRDRETQTSGSASAQQLADRALVRRVGVRVQQADGDDSTPSPREGRAPAARAASSSGATTAPSTSDPLLDLEPEPPLDERRAAFAGSRTGAGMRSRRSSRTSRKPAVVSSAVRAPARSRIALVATVVPWTTSRMSAGSTPEASRSARRPRRRRCCSRRGWRAASRSGSRRRRRSPRCR